MVLDNIGNDQYIDPIVNHHESNEMSQDDKDQDAPKVVKKQTAQSLIDSIDAEVHKARVGEVKNKAKGILTEIAKAEEVVASKKQQLKDLIEENEALFSKTDLNMD